MTARRGWCPSLHEPMATGDGLLVRVKPRGMVLSARAVRVLAGAAVSFGNGVLDLTQRGSVQARGLSAASAPRFAAEMVAAGLASPGVAEERRRSVIATPLAGVDPAAHPATRAVTASLEIALEEAEDLGALPAKFSFAVDGGGRLPLGDIGADILVRLRADRAEVALAGGAQMAAVAVEAGVSAALSLTRGFLALGGAGRMRALVAAVGEAAVFTSAELVPAPASPGAGARAAVGWHGDVFGAGLPFGSAMASDWVRLADASARWGDGALRLTPWRAVLIADVEDVDPLRLRIEQIGLIVDPDDPRRLIDACPGQPGCASASVATRDVASRLRPVPGRTVHVSGCSKGCAHPGPAALTFVGREGRFDLVRSGSAGDVPALRGLGEAEMMAL